MHYEVQNVTISYLKILAAYIAFGFLCVKVVIHRSKVSSSSFWLLFILVVKEKIEVPILDQGVDNASSAFIVISSWVVPAHL